MTFQIFLCGDCDLARHRKRNAVEFAASAATVQTAPPTDPDAAAAR